MTNRSASGVSSCLQGSFGLCLGSGVTREFVGDWNALLSKMLLRRFASGWAAKGHSYADVRVPEEKSARLPIGFFADEGPLEVGEFLLADDSLMTPEQYKADQAAWQERFFSRQVSDVVHESIADKLCESCESTTCSKLAKCSLHADGKHTLGDVYEAFCHMTGFAAKDDDDVRDCDYLKKALTTMTVVELCARKNVRFVVNYNFDTVVEEMLYGAITKALVDTDIERIHIWTSGQIDVSNQLLDSRRCKIVLHRGGWVDGAPDLLEGAKGSIHFFHVHGIGSGADIPDLGDRLVFSQHSYRAYQDAPFNWSNQILQYVLARHRLIGIGFSGTDANFRHFAWNYMRSMPAPSDREGSSVEQRIVFLKSNNTFRERAEEMADDSDLRSFLRDCSADMVERYYGAYYGVHTVWVNSYQELARELHEAANA